MPNLRKIIQRHLTDDLLKKEYRGSRIRFFGHCYVASEAAYHYLPTGYQPYYAKDPAGFTHWWLQSKSGTIFDPTSEQYTDRDLTPPYASGRAAAFLTKEPSKRAKELLYRICLEENQLIRTEVGRLKQRCHEPGREKQLLINELKNGKT